MFFIWKVGSASSRDIPFWRTILISCKINVEVISGRLCVELLADAGDVFVGESRSCETVEASERFDLRRLEKRLTRVGISHANNATRRCRPG